MAGSMSACIVIPFNIKLLFICFVCSVLMAGIAILVIYLSAALSAYYETKALPRKEMILCDKHGAYPKEASLYIQVPAEGKNDLAVEMCPMCYADKIKDLNAKIKGK